MAAVGKVPSKVLIGGPTNSLVEHGTGQGRGFFPERKIVIRRDVEKGEEEWRTTFHMSGPRKISLAERRGLVDRAVRLIRGAQLLFPWAEICYLTMFP